MAEGSWVVFDAVIMEEVPCRVTDGGGGVGTRCLAPKFRSSRKLVCLGVRLTAELVAGGACGGGGWLGEPQ